MEGSTKKTKHSNVPEGGRRQLEVGRPGMRSLSETCKHRRNQPCKDPQEESPRGGKSKVQRPRGGNGPGVLRLQWLVNSC